MKAKAEAQAKLQAQQQQQQHQGSNGGENAGGGGGGNQGKNGAVSSHFLLASLPPLLSLLFIRKREKRYLTTTESI